MQQERTGRNARKPAGVGRKRKERNELRRRMDDAHGGSRHPQESSGREATIPRSHGEKQRQNEDAQDPASGCHAQPVRASPQAVPWRHEYRFRDRRQARTTLSLLRAQKGLPAGRDQWREERAEESGKRLTTLTYGQFIMRGRWALDCGRAVIALVRSSDSSRHRSGKHLANGIDHEIWLVKMNPVLTLVRDNLAHAVPNALQLFL